MHQRIPSRFARLVGATVIAGVLALASGCSDSGHPRGLFTGRVMEKTEAEITEDIGKPASVDATNPQRVKWVYKRKTFDPDNMNTPDNETNLYFKPDASGKLKVSEVGFN